MKKILVLLSLLVAVSTTSVVSAQKIGKVTFQEVLFVLPETESVQTQITDYAMQLDEQLEIMRVELNNKIEDYQNKQATYSPAIKEQKEKELNELNARIQEFSQTAQADIQELQQKLTQPLFVKVQEAIASVAKEQAVLMVVDLSQGNNIMYIDEANSVDITPLVKVALGVAADAKPKEYAQ